MATEEIKIWTRFTAKRSSDDVSLKFRIQNMTKDRMEEVVDLQCNYFLRDEPCHKAVGTYKSKKANEESRDYFKKFLHDPTAHVVVCYLEDGTDPPALIGVSCMQLVDKNDKDDDKRLKDTKISSAETLKFFELLKIMKQVFDVYETCNVQKCYEDRGLVVHPDYRGYGLAREFLKTRRLVCQAEGVPVTESWMTSIGSQKAAERDGWKTAIEVPVEEFEQQLNVSFGMPSGIFKAMYAEIK